MELETLVRIAGSLQLLQLPLMTIAGRKLGWNAELSRLTLVNRRLFRAIGLGIVIYVMGTGVIVIVHARAMTHTELGVWLCVLQAIAWMARLVQQLFGIRAHIPAASRSFARVATSVYASLALAYLGVCAWLFLWTPTPG